MSSVVISGNTSGTITLDAPAVAGTTTLTLPATSGTVLASGTAVTVAQGGTGLTSAGTNGNVLTSNGTIWTSATLSNVTSLNGQTGAITITTVDAIGSFYISSDDTATIGARTIGTTYAGNTLLKINSAGTRVNAGLTGTYRMMGANENSANTSRLYTRVS